MRGEGALTPHPPARDAVEYGAVAIEDGRFLRHIGLINSP